MSRILEYCRYFSNPRAKCPFLSGGDGGGGVCEWVMVEVMVVVVDVLPQLIKAAHFQTELEMSSLIE